MNKKYNYWFYKNFIHKFKIYETVSNQCNRILKYNTIFNAYQ